MRKTLSLVVCFLVISLVLCACKSSNSSADGVQSATGETQSVADAKTDSSEQTVSVAVDPVLFDVNNYSTWFFAERTDLVTPEAAAEIKAGMRWSEVVNLLGKPQFDYALETELRFCAFDSEGKISDEITKEKVEGSFVIKTAPIYKLTNGKFLCLDLSLETGDRPEEFYYDIYLSDIVDDVDNVSIAFGRLYSSWYSSEEKGSKKHTPEEFQKLEGMVWDEAYKVAGKPWGYNGATGEFVYILSDGSSAELSSKSKIVNCKRISFAKIVSCTGYLYLDPDVGEQVEVFIDSKTGELVKRTTYDKIELERKTIS